MNKRALIMLVIGIIAVVFLGVDITLLCVYKGKILAIGLPFFACMTGFGLSMMALCLIWLLDKKEEEKRTCPACGKECSAKYAYCPSCGSKF